MSDVANAIMDAAERRIRKGGFNGFSFREIALDVGIKSSSVHYHFPTKEKLAAAVIRRYTDTITERVHLKVTENPVHTWIKAFRATVHSETHMCPCIVLGAASANLPPEVSAEVQRFFETCIEMLVSEGLSSPAAHALLAQITGGIVLACSTGDLKAYDRATSNLG